MDVVRHSEFIAACSDLLEVDLSQLVTYDVVEYGALRAQAATC